MPHAASTVDSEEIERFTNLSHTWWDANGPFAPLHRINPVRVSYVRDCIYSHIQKQDMKGISLLDIGCGGGLVCEPMARLGAKVTGIDAGDKNVEAAKIHAAQSKLEIDYRCTSAEALAETGERFDVVLALEIIEHVADIPAFVNAVASLAKPGGLIIFSTINRTAKAYALAIVGAEYVLRWLPRGTHDWKKFVKPSELAAELRRNDLSMGEMAGLVFNPLEGGWRINKNDVDVNYFLSATKR